ncbi:MAG: PKD domain-containing protein [Methanotrichaceae archaeon]
MRLKIGGIAGIRLFTSILLLSAFISAQAQSYSENGVPAADSKILDVGESIRHMWLDHSVIPPEAFNRAPVMPSRPAGPISGMPAVAYSYSVSASDPDGDRLSYTVDWGDGTASTLDKSNQGEAVIFDHRWAKAGSYRIRSRVTDCHGSSSQWSEPLIIIINSLPDRPSTPVGKTSGRPGSSYFFSVTANDPDGDCAKYTFDWGDKSFSRTNYSESGMEVSIYHVWAKAGIYQVKARATDCRGASSQWSEPITVIINTPPDSPSSLSGPRTGYARVPYRFLTSAFDHDRDSLVYTFDWGDGTVDISDFVEPGVSASSTHTWNGPGTYCMRANAVDSVGSQSNWSEKSCIAVLANDRPDMPRDLYGLRSGCNGIAYTYFTMAQDPDGDSVKYVLDWGDGNISATDYVKSGSLENASHIWSRAGEYVVRARAIDIKGAPSNWSRTFRINIAANDPPDPPVMPSGPTTGQCKRTYEYITSAEDPDGDQVKYVFDWGDGTTSWTGLDYVKSGEERKAYHKWTDPGVFQIKAIAIDNKGTFSGWSKTLAVDMV